MIKNFVFCVLFIHSGILSAQTDHWETVIPVGDNFSYIVPGEEITNWRTSSFDDNGWQTGPTPIGYGESNVQTNTGSIITLYVRKEFTIVDLSDIEEAVLHMDYDDGFVAYLNGAEIARGFMSGSPPTFNQTSDGLHESGLYQGIAPDVFSFDRNLLVNGTNTLAVEVHNDNSGSSDLIATPVLSVGVNISEQTYLPTPDWFYTPFNFTSSDLPIVLIDTNGEPIPDDPKIPGTIGIIYNGEGNQNNITDPYNELDWFIGIEQRGESSQSFAKKSYGFETWDALGNDIDTTFLNFPSEEDFILYGPYSDKTQLNNVLTMFIGNKMGRYASRTRFVELVVNDDYKGLYVLMEKIKRDNERVNISKLNPDEISGDDLTGGYIVRIDKGVYAGWQSQYGAYANGGNKIFYQYYYPDQDDIQAAQGAYIKSVFDDFENAAMDNDFTNDLGQHYSEYIDLKSFVDTFILNELSKNVDAYRLSTYFHKQKDSRGGRIVAGPLWDFNLAFGNGNYCAGDDVTGWEYYQCTGNSPAWWDNMLNDPVFTNGLKCRWDELRSGMLSDIQLNSTIDSLVTIIGEAQARNFQRWPVLGTYLWPNPDYFYQGINSHDQIISAMQNWISGRVDWLDSNIPGAGTNCEDAFPEIVLNSDEFIDDLKVYPNPSNGIFRIESSRKILNIQLFGTDGKSKEITPTKSGYFKLNESSGFYLLLIRTDQGSILRKLIIK